MIVNNFFCKYTVKSNGTIVEFHCDLKKVGIFISKIVWKLFWNLLLVPVELTVFEKKKKKHKTSLNLP